MTNEMPDHLRQGRETYARHAWDDAYHAFLCADEVNPLEADDLERLATAAYMIGRELEFQRLIERLHQIHLEADNSERAARCAFWLTLGFLFRGDVGQSNAWAARGHRLVQGRDSVERGYMLPAYLDIMLAEGDVENSRDACQELQALAEEFDTDILRAVAEQAHGAVALGHGDPRAAIAPLRRAFELWERLEAPYEAARVRVLVGQTCQALGDDEAAGLEFDAARSVFAQLGAQPDLARLDTTCSPTSRPGPLTARELDVLRLIAAGHTNKGIAGELCLSQRTIDRHVSNILSKLDVPSRTAAIVYAYNHKLI
jgi:DNA-binding CsgD family transcriptional regulator